MENLFKKLGIYDLMGVMIPGVIVTLYYAYTFSSEFGDLCDKLKLDDNLYKMLLLVIISYFMGVVLHEIGTYFIEILHNFFRTDLDIKDIKDDKISLNPFGNVRYNFKNEIAGAFNGNENYKHYVFEEIYSQIKYGNRDRTLVDKFLSIYGLARGIFVGFFLHIFVYFFYCIWNCESIDCCIILIDVVGAAIFFIRTYRYFYSWVKNVRIRYHIGEKEMSSSTKQTAGSEDDNK